MTAADCSEAAVLADDRLRERGDRMRNGRYPEYDHDEDRTGPVDR